MRKIKIWIITGMVFLTGICVVSSFFAQQKRTVNFGWEWVRNHPFTITALTVSPGTLDMKTYAEAGMNTLLVWEHWEDLVKKAAEAKMPWHFYAVHKSPERDQDRFRRQKEDTEKWLSLYPGCEALLIGDETRPAYAQECLVAQFEWARQKFPDKLIYTNVYASGKDYGPIPGTDPPESYSYGFYLDTMVRLTGTDVLSFDMYPITYSDTESLIRQRWFNCLVEVRAAAQRANIPYWTFIQAMDTGKQKNKYRYPSESEVRLLVYSALTYGFTGIQYFIYQGEPFLQAILDLDGSPGKIYPQIADINAEVKCIGKALRQLKSMKVCYFSDREIPEGTQAFCRQDGVPCHITDITFDKPMDTSEALLGFFQDDERGNYFMLTNLQHTDKSSSEQMALTFTIEFDSTIKKICRLSRKTGKVEVMPVRNGKIELTLPGGTGDLFKVGNAGFPGL